MVASTVVRSKRSFEYSRSTRNGGGGSGRPWNFEVVHGTRRSMPKGCDDLSAASAAEATALRAIPRNANQIDLDHESSEIIERSWMAGGTRRLPRRRESERGLLRSIIASESRR